MKIKITILILILLFWNIELVSAEENEYGIVKAWINEKNATIETIEGVKLKIGEPSEIKVEVISKVEGHVFVALTETGVTKAFDVLNGPSKQDKRLDNLNIDKGWSKTFIWKVTPNGAWTNGNAPINIYVGFYNTKTKTDKNIQFTIANPYILDEQYSGADAMPEASTSPEGTPAKPAPFLTLIFTVSALLLAWGFIREKC